MKRLLLDYWCGSVEYINVRNFEIKYPFITIDNNKISLWDVEFIKYKNFIAWKNRKTGGKNKCGFMMKNS